MTEPVKGRKPKNGIVLCVKCGATCVVGSAVRFEDQWYCGWPCFELDVNQAVDQVMKMRERK